MSLDWGRGVDSCPEHGPKYIWTCFMLTEVLLRGFAGGVDDVTIIHEGATKLGIDRG